MNIILLAVFLFQLPYLSATPTYDIIDLGATYFDGETSATLRLNESGVVMGNREIYVPYTLKVEGFRWTAEEGYKTFDDHGSSLIPVSLTDQGIIGGYVNINRAFKEKSWIWHPEDGFLNLNDEPALNGDLASMMVQAVNDKGTIAGYGHLRSPAPVKSVIFLYNRETGLKTIDLYAMRVYLPLKINQNDQLIGNSEKDGFLYDPQIGLIDFRRLNPDGEASRAVDLNERGEVAGYVVDSKEQKQAFFYSPAKGLQLIGPSTSSGKKSKATALNDQGEVVGIMTTAGFSDDQHAFFWSKKKGRMDLGALDGKYSKAMAINNHSNVVGYYSKKKSGYMHDNKAFLWTPKKGMQDLFQLIPQDQGWISLARVTGINDKGEIVGIGLREDYRATHEAHLFKLIPKE